jgi:hypothetical protein
MDGSIPSKAPAAPGDPFLGRIKASSVPPPNRDTVIAVKRTIAKSENIKLGDRSSTRLFLTPYSQSPMGDDDRLTIFNRTGPGSTPQEPLVFVATEMISDSERTAYDSKSDSESGGRLECAGEPEPDTTPPVIYRTSIQDPPTFIFVLISRLLWGT